MKIKYNFFAYSEIAGLTTPNTCFKATTSPAAEIKAIKLLKTETNVGVNFSPTCKPDNPITSKAITAIKNGVLSFSPMLRKPTIKPNTQRINAKEGISANPAKIARIIPIISAQRPISTVIFLFYSKRFIRSTFVILNIGC